MRVLVTGAGGFIGKNLVKELVDSHDVKALVCREKPGEKEFLEEKGAEVVLGDVTEKNSVEGVAENVDVVFNLAAQRRGWTESENSSHMVNVVGTRNMVKEAVSEGVEQFIHCSTSSVIGPVKDEPLDESSERRDTSRVYYRTKLEGDREVLARKEDIPVTVVMPPLVYGPHDVHHLPLFKAVRDRKIHFVGRADNLFQPTFVDDCVEMFKRCMKNEKAYGERIITGAEKPRKTRDIIFSIAEALDKDIHPIRIPRPLAWAGYHVLEFLGEILGFKPPLNKRVYDWFTENHFFDVSKAEEILGFEADWSLEEGMERTVSWYQDKGWL